MLLKMILLAVFGIAMGHFEGVVVVYLRKALGIQDIESNKVSVGNFPRRFLWIEISREAVTIIMLAVIAWIAGDTILDKVLMFLWTFAFWDLIYYVSLYVLIKWPPSLGSMDVLFLIPAPWIAPVWFPVGISTATIVFVGLFYIMGVV